MSLLFIASLLILCSCFVFFYSAFRKNTFQRTGFIFLIMVFIYHGLSEIFNRIFPGYNLYRINIDIENIDKVLFLISLTMFLFTISYLFATRTKKHFCFNNELTVKIYGFFLQNKIPLIVLSAVLFSIMQYYKVDVEILSQTGMYEGYWLFSLSNSLWPILLILALLSLLLTHSKYFSPNLVFIYLAVILTTLSSRSGMLVNLFFLFIMMRSLGYKLKKKIIFMAIIYSVIFIFIVSSTRENIGRYNVVQSKPFERIQQYSSNINISKFI